MTVTAQTPRANSNSGSADSGVKTPRHPAGDLDGIITGSGLSNYLRTNRTYAMVAKHGFEEAGSELRRAIMIAAKDAQQRNGGEGPNGRATAAYVTRPLKHAAALQESVARSMGVTLQRAIAKGLIGRPKGDSRGAFNPAK